MIGAIVLWSLVAIILFGVLLAVMDGVDDRHASVPGWVKGLIVVVIFTWIVAITVYVTWPSIAS